MEKFWADPVIQNWNCVLSYLLFYCTSFEKSIFKKILSSFIYFGSWSCVKVTWEVHLSMQFFVIWKERRWHFLPSHPYRPLIELRLVRQWKIWHIRNRSQKLKVMVDPEDIMETIYLWVTLVERIQTHFTPVSITITHYCKSYHYINHPNREFMCGSLLLFEWFSLRFIVNIIKMVKQAFPSFCYPL